MSLLYRSLLHRSPDEAGLAGGLYTINQLGFQRGIETISDGIVGSDEYKWLHRNLFDFSEILSENTKRLIAGKGVEHIISLGTHYQASSILKKYGLKSQSFPFDWLFSSPDAILHCIQDNFDKFLDKSYYKSLEPKNGEARADHEFYKKFYNVDSFFAHRDPVKADDHQFFMRCVDRFREIVGGGSAKLFVMISGNHHDLVGTFEKLHEWVSKLDSANIIAIQLRDPMDGRSLRKVRAESHGDLYEFSPKSAEEGLGFPNLLDDLTVLKLVAEYQITQNARSARRSMG